MKIAILTILDNWENYGSVLQMLALKNWLEDQGNEVSFIKPPKRLDMTKRDISNYAKRQKVDKTKKFYSLRKLNKIRRIVVFAVKTVSMQLKNKLRYRKMFLRIDITDVKDMDVVVMGSDTLWDLKNHVFQDSFYWGKEIFDFGVPVVTYAVSADGTEEFDLEKYPWIPECISRLHSISVRDSHTKKLISPFFQNEITVVADPTFLYPETLNISCDKIEHKYILIYSFDLSEEEIGYITRFAKEEGVLIVCAMGLLKYDFADINIDCGFTGFSEMVKNASYMYTSTFHGCMFSIIHNVKTIYRTNSNKTKDLMSMFGLSQRVFRNGMSQDDFQTMLKSDINLGELEKIKLSIRRQSEEYLKSVLTDVKKGSEKN